MALAALLWLAAVSPGLFALRVLVRSRPRPREGAIALLTVSLGAVLGVVTTLLERSMERTDATTGAAGLFVALAVFAPLEESAKALVAWQVFRRVKDRDPYEGLVLAAAASLGLVLVKTGWSVHDAEARSLRLFVRIALAVPAHLFVSSLWGYLLGRSFALGAPRRLFFLAWLGAVILRASLDVLFGMRGRVGLVGAVPLLALMAFATASAARDLGRRTLAKPRLSLPSAPSLRTIGEAFARKRDRPIALPWVALGALVNQGVLFVLVAIAVVVGRRAGVDFSTVEATEVGAAAPLAFLGAAAFLSFPVSGYLVARASDASNVLEPALGAALSLLGLLVLVGVAAPVGLAFGLACAPVAFTLACAGAWIGLAR